MKVLVIGYRFDAAGGLEIVSAGLAKALAQLGHEVQCAAASTSESWQADGYRGVGLSPRNRWMRHLHIRLPTLTSGIRLRRLLAWCDVAIICHCHLLPLVQQCLPRGSSRPAVLAWLHGREVWGDFIHRYKASLRQADLLVAVSRYTSDSVTTSLGEQHRPIVIPNPVDTGVFHPLPDASRVIRRSLFTVGRHDDETQHKGYDLVLEAMALLRSRKSPPITLTIGGSGPRLAFLEQLAHRLGIGDQVRVVGKLSRSELVHHHATADLFVFPSRLLRIGGNVWGEGFGVVNIEAAACGRPVLTSTHGGCPETIQNGKTGVLVDPTDVTAIADGISAVLNLPADERDAMGRRGREFVVEQFSFRAYSRRLEQLIEQATQFVKG
jgi:phosphatidylinositol alpha-1,6-mannosyltransferase